MLSNLFISGGDTSFSGDQENSRVTVQKELREQRNGRTSRKEQDSCSPFQACVKLIFFLPVFLVFA